MICRPIGPLRASTIVLGTWSTGGFQWGGTDEAESIRAIHAALDAGVNIIDTAPIYGFGESEKRIGQAVRDRRDRVLLATKCGMVWQGEKGKFFSGANDRGLTQDGSGTKIFRYLHPESIRDELEQSLRRLGTDHVDLYQIHRLDDCTPFSEIMGALMDLKKQGKIRAVGVSNVTVEELRSLGEAGVVDSDQERYSIFDRGVETKNIRYCAENKMAFIAYSPLFHGLLSGAFSESTRFHEGDFRADRLRFAPEYVARVNSMLSRLKSIALEHGATSAQLVLAYLLGRPGCTHVAVGARKAAHAAENARAADVILAQPEAEEIHRLFTLHLPPLASEKAPQR